MAEPTTQGERIVLLDLQPARSKPIVGIVKLTNSLRPWLVLLIASCCLNSSPLSGEEISREQIEEIRKAAELGDAEAQFNLGVCYDNGQGVVKNETEAYKWYRKAAELGDAEAQFNLGVCYDNGQGVVKNEDEAVKWYRKAAEQGDAEAQFNLGVCYDNGQGVVKNETEAVKWYRKAAEQGDAEAQFNLGVCFDNGQGVVKDETEALKWYLLSAVQEDEDSKQSASELESILSSDLRAEGQRKATEWQAEFEARKNR